MISGKPGERTERKESFLIKTWMSHKKNRRLSLLVAGTVGMTLALGAAPPCWTNDLGVEIGASVAHAETAEDGYKEVKVSGWGNSRQSFRNGEKVRLVKDDGTALATFTAPTVNDISTPAYLSYSPDGAKNGTITMDGERIKDVTIYENTKLKWDVFAYPDPGSSITLKGEGASYIYCGFDEVTLAEGSKEATISQGIICNSTYWSITGTDGTKLSKCGNPRLQGQPQ